MKTFHAFVTVWHTKDNQYNVSNYTYYAVCSGEQEAKRMIAKEVKGYRYWKHHADLEEIKGDEKKLRHLSWQGLTDKIFNEAVLQQLEVNRKENKKLKCRMEKSDYHSATHIPVVECLKDPKYFYFILKNLTPVSKVFIAGGKFHIYEIGKKRHESLFKTEFENEKNKLTKKMKERIRNAFMELLGVLEE